MSEAQPIFEKGDLEKTIESFKKKLGPNDRYASFDYCLQYFTPKEGKSIEDDMEKSCMVLGFYLASWGMYRGSSFLLRRSAKHLEETIKYIAELGHDHAIWKIDANNYTKDKNIDKIIEVYKGIQNAIMPEGKHHAHLTLVTKIMLGVFGCIPAFDTYFTDTFREIAKEKKKKCAFRKVDKKSLSIIAEFYADHDSEIDQLAEDTLCSIFNPEDSGRPYTKAKIIDMYGFQKVADKKEAEKEAEKEEKAAKKGRQR